MKILIWILCCFVYAFITTILKEIGIRLGAIPTMALFGGIMWLAQTLCKKWEAHKSRKQKTPNRREVPSQHNVSNATGYGYTVPKENVESDNTVPKYDTQLRYLPQNKTSTMPTQTQHTIRYCRMCGNKLVPGSLFCNKCGTKIFTSND